MAQLEARLDGIEEVRGSNPLGSTNLKWPFMSISCRVKPQAAPLTFTLGEMNLQPVLKYLRPNLGKLDRVKYPFANERPRRENTHMRGTSLPYWCLTLQAERGGCV